LENQTHAEQFLEVADQQNLFAWHDTCVTEFQAQFKASFSWWLYKRGSLGLETARPMGAQLLKNAAAWLGPC
jgi:hypothetical protein